LFHDHNTFSYTPGVWESKQDYDSLFLLDIHISLSWCWINLSCKAFISLILEKSVLLDSYTLSAFATWIRKNKSQNSFDSSLHYLYLLLTLPVWHLLLIHTILYMLSYNYSWGSVKLNIQFQNTVIYRFQLEHLSSLITVLLCFAEWLLTNECGIILHTSHINIRKQHMDAFINFEHSAFSNNKILTLYCYEGYFPINEI
jgi:hypothetical protein